jgi:hypothetical protein
MKNLRSIVDELKFLFRPKGIDHGRMYDALKEMDLLTAGPLPGEEEQWELDFIAREGTREQFINERTKKKEA